MFDNNSKGKKFSSLVDLLPNMYYMTPGKLIKKHCNSFKRIYTTCGDWSTPFPSIFQRCYYMQRVIVGLEKLFHH